MGRRYGWSVGRYVIMPDHVHFFIMPGREVSHRLGWVVGKWKELTAKQVIAIGISGAPIWQAGFFDHVIRSAESRSEKWSYVRQNPVRAGLVPRCEDWPYAGAVDFE